MNVNGSEERSGKIPSRLRRSVWKTGLDVGMRGALRRFRDLLYDLDFSTGGMDRCLTWLINCNRKSKIERKLFAGGVGAGP